MVLPIFKVTMIRTKNLYILFLIWLIFPLNIVHCSQYVGGGRGDDRGKRKIESTKLHPPGYGSAENHSKPKNGALRRYFLLLVEGGFLLPELSLAGQLSPTASPQPPVFSSCGLRTEDCPSLRWSISSGSRWDLNRKG